MIRKMAHSKGTGGEKKELLYFLCGEIFRYPDREEQSSMA